MAYPLVEHRAEERGQRIGRHGPVRHAAIRGPLHDRQKLQPPDAAVEEEAIHLHGVRGHHGVQRAKDIGLDAVALQQPQRPHDKLVRGAPSLVGTAGVVKASGPVNADADVEPALRQRALSDEQLDRTGALPLADGASVSTQQLIEGGVLIGHVTGHLASIRAAG